MKCIPLCFSFSIGSRMTTRQSKQLFFYARSVKDTAHTSDITCEALSSGAAYGSWTGPACHAACSMPWTSMHVTYSMLWTLSKPQTLHATCGAGPGHMLHATRPKMCTGSNTWDWFVLYGLALHHSSLRGLMSLTPVLRKQGFVK